MQKKYGWGYWLRLLVFALVSGLVILIVTQAYLLSDVVVRPAPSQVCCRTPADGGLDYEDVTLTAEDGASLHGWYIPSQNDSAVVLLHGYGGNRLGMMDTAVILARSGFGVLLYDLRASGESEGAVRSWGWQDVDDVRAAVNYLQTREDVAPRKIGILGCSTGAEIAVVAAGRYPELKAVVAEGGSYATLKDIPPPFDLEGWMALPFSPLFLKMIQWKSGVEPGGSLTDAVPQISPRPLLLITAGEGLEQVQGERFFNLSGEPRQLWNLPEADHCGGLQERPQEYEERVTTFFEQAFADQ